jgi:hypothetical protein
MNHQVGIINDAVPNIESHAISSEKDRLATYDSLIKKLFYACECCDGALIQLAVCTVCRRAIIRRCTQCSTELKISHPMCEIPNNVNSSHNYSTLGMNDQ